MTANNTINENFIYTGEATVIVKISEITWILGSFYLIGIFGSILILGDLWKKVVTEHNLPESFIYLELTSMSLLCGFCIEQFRRCKYCSYRAECIVWNL